jgi:hypothetical protein
MNLPSDLEKQCMDFIKSGGYIYMRICERHGKPKYLAIIERRFGGEWRSNVSEDTDVIRALRYGLESVGYVEDSGPSTTN